jgi:hypothetical protein
MATITRKFSKTQQALWNQIRHAFPEGLGEHGPAQWHRGAISAGHNLTATVKALESLGLIRIQEIGGRISDRVIPVCPLGERSVVLMPGSRVSGTITHTSTGQTLRQSRRSFGRTDGM